jgi:hypothetical protein
MLANVALAIATAGLLAILWMIYREVRDQAGPLEKNSLVAGAVTVVLVAVWHIATTAGGGGH